MVRRSAWVAACRRHRRPCRCQPGVSTPPVVRRSCAGHRRHLDSPPGVHRQCHRPVPPPPFLCRRRHRRPRQCRHPPVRCRVRHRQCRHPAVPPVRSPRRCSSRPPCAGRPVPRAVTAATVGAERRQQGFGDAPPVPPPSQATAITSAAATAAPPRAFPPFPPFSVASPRRPARRSPTEPRRLGDLTAPRPQPLLRPAAHLAVARALRRRHPHRCSGAGAASPAVCLLLHEVTLGWTADLLGELLAEGRRVFTDCLHPIGAGDSSEAGDLGAQRHGTDGRESDAAMSDGSTRTAPAIGMTAAGQITTSFASGTSSETAGQRPHRSCRRVRRRRAARPARRAQASGCRGFADDLEAAILQKGTKRPRVSGSPCPTTTRTLLWFIPLRSDLVGEVEPLDHTDCAVGRPGSRPSVRRSRT